ncbi:MAG: Lrp/AsnC ligand binding domain-containing protein [Hoeflea sp.]|uniref:Lrp/AsnC ligand binding domain-containing protein n=1 Tax=Hoeflea sp. TaxID=1940281 RepID=UPI0032986870
MRRKLDPTDRRILNALQSFGRLSIVDLAERVHLTKTPCSERVKRLEREGVIMGYSATLNPAEVEMDHVMIVHVNLAKTSESALEDFNQAIKQIPEVQTCLMIAGPFDYMLKVRTRDISHFRELLGERISQLPAVMQTHSYAVMETVKETAMIELRG